MVTPKKTTTRALIRTCTVVVATLSGGTFHPVVILTAYAVKRNLVPITVRCAWYIMFVIGCTAIVAVSINVRVRSRAHT